MCPSGAVTDSFQSGFSSKRSFSVGAYSSMRSSSGTSTPCWPYLMISLREKASTHGTRKYASG